MPQKPNPTRLTTTLHLVLPSSPDKLDSSSLSLLFNVRIFPSRMGLDGWWLPFTSVNPAPHPPPLPTSSYLHHIITALFPRTSCRLSPPDSHLPHLTQCTPSALFSCPNHLSLLCLNITERSSTPHIYAISLLDLPSCHLTPAMYLGILRSHLCDISISLLVNAHVSAPCSKADLTQASYTVPFH